MCTRILWNSTQPNCSEAIVVGRNMDWDWDKPLETDLFVLPRGISRRGGVTPNPVTWKAKYGSLVATVSWIAENGKVTASADGINEKRLAGHLLWLEDGKYADRERSRPALNVGLWLQYYLDRFETVAQVVNHAERASEKKNFQLVPFDMQGQTAHLHLVIEDESGDSAVIEYKEDGCFEWHPTMVVTNTWTCMTAPLLERYERGDELSLPGTSSSQDRYVRAVHYLKNLPRPRKRRETIAYLVSIMRNVAQPFQENREGEPSQPNTTQPNATQPNAELPNAMQSNATQPSATQWRTVCDLSNGYFYFESTTRPNIFWVRLDGLNFAEGANVMRLPLSAEDPDPVGDVTWQFQPCPHFRWPIVDTNESRRERQVERRPTQRGRRSARKTRSRQR